MLWYLLPQCHINSLLKLWYFYNKIYGNSRQHFGKCSSGTKNCLSDTYAMPSVIYLGVQSVIPHVSLTILWGSTRVHESSFYTTYIHPSCQMIYHWTQHIQYLYTVCKWATDSMFARCYSNMTNNSLHNFCNTKHKITTKCKPPAWSNCCTKQKSLLGLGKQVLSTITLQLVELPLNWMLIIYIRMCTHWVIISYTLSL